MQRAVSFEGAAPDIYDRCLGPALFEPYAAGLARRVLERPGNAVLETACGTGILTRQLRLGLAPAVRLVATDLSTSMIDTACRRLRGVARIAWRRADFAELPFPDRSFSALACQFGLMFAADKAAALGEARRALVDGGLLAFTVWAGLDHNMYARVVHEAIARLLPFDPPVFFEVAYGSGDAEEWRRLLHALGFEVQALDQVTLAVHSPTAERLALGLVRGTPVGRAIEERGGDVDRFVEAATGSLARLGGDAPFQSTTRALVITATVKSAGRACR